MSDQQRQTGQPAPMTEARLAEIRIRAQQIDAEGLGEILYPGSDNALPPRQWGMKVDQLVSQDVPDLLAFVEAALPILRAVAEGRARPGFGVCQHCEAYRLMGEHPRTHTWVVTDDYDHTNDCPVTASRALLAGTAGAADEGSEQG